MDALSAASFAESLESKSGRAAINIETIFQAQYARIARAIARVIRDRSRAEELAVEVFLKWSRTSSAQGENAEGWLYRTAARMALNELRRVARRNRYERLVGWLRGTATPEEILMAQEEQEWIRRLLAGLPSRQAQLLLLRSEGLSYEELAGALDLNPASVGTLLRRAQQACRKEYIQQYGKGRYGEE